MKKYIPHAWNFLLTMCIILSVTVMAIEFCTYDDKFFEKQYLSYGASETIGSDMPSIMAATDRLQDYIKGAVPSLDIEVERGGITQQFFNEREKDHMVDVLVLFNVARVIKYICLAVLAAYILLCIFLKLNPFGSLFCKTYIKSVLVIVGIGLCAALIISINFDAAWTFMHTVVFSNDLWLLDPATDMLINLVPLEFFVAITSRIGILILSVLAAIFSLCVWGLRKTKKGKALEESRDAISKGN